MITVIPDLSLVIQMINFLVLLFILNIILFRPIRSILIEREKKARNLEIRAGNVSSDMATQKESYKKGLQEARDEGLKNKQSFIEEGRQAEEEIVDRINRKTQASLAEIRKQVAEETQQARKTLEGQIDVYAKAISKKILGRAC